jgi:hypothetical protein
MWTGLNWPKIETNGGLHKMSEYLLLRGLIRIIAIYVHVAAIICGKCAITGHAVA